MYGTNTFSERTIKDICRIYNVNEEWLRTGNGEPYVPKTKNEEIAEMEAPKDNSLVRFYDEHKRLKLTIAPSSILYVKSELNYVVVYYLDAGKVKNYQIRCSMKSIEDSADKHFLCRCQRSYFVNPEHV